MIKQATVKVVLLGMDNEKVIRDLITRFLELIGADVTGLEIKQESEQTKVSATVSEAGFLIGHDGENLKAIQHILALMVARQTQEIFKPNSFTIDINNYRQDKENYLTALAKNSAAEVLATKKSVELEPMPAYERRIVHITLEKIAGVKSESAGEGEGRRIVIKPVFE